MLAHQDDSDLRRDTSFCKDIVSSSEQSHNPNVCVAVIFVPIFQLSMERRIENAEEKKETPQTAKWIRKYPLSWQEQTQLLCGTSTSKDRSAWKCGSLTCNLLC